MRYILMLVITSVLSCNQKSNQPVVADVQEDQKPLKLEVYDFDGLEKFLYQDDDKVHVVNFWATWCAPCVKELPYFEKLKEAYQGQNVEVLLISLDFPSQYEKKLKPFIQKNRLKSKVIALDDVDMNTWLPKVDENWSGAIPATIIYNKDKRQFYEQSFNYETLENEVKQFIK